MNVSFNHSKTQEQALQDSQINKGTIYFTTDNSIVHDGKIYGVSSEDKSAIAAILSAITNTDGQLGVNMLPYVLQSESEYSSGTAQNNVFYFLYEDNWGFGDNFPVTLE